MSQNKLFPSSNDFQISLKISAVFPSFLLKIIILPYFFANVLKTHKTPYGGPSLSVQVTCVKVDLHLDGEEINLDKASVPVIVKDAKRILQPLLSSLH